MSINNKVTKIKQERIRKQINQCDILRFSNLLRSEELRVHFDECIPEFRQRLYPPTETLSMFLTQALSQDRSCQHIVNKASFDNVLEGKPTNSVSTGAYCKARQRIPLELIQRLTRETAYQLSKHVPLLWKWKGKRVKLIDGTSVTMPDTADNQRVFPQQKARAKGLGFPICRLVGVVCLSTGAVVDAAVGKIEGKGTSEQSLLRQLQDRFEEGDLILGDAYFSTYFFLAFLIEGKVDAVMEQLGVRKKSVDFRKGEKIGSKDHVITLQKPKRRPDWMTQEEYQSAPQNLKIRELKVGGKILVTTILSPKDATKSELKNLYKQRWHVELDFRNIKTTLKMEHLSCKSADMSEKEIWVYFLAYNLIRILMCQAALLSERLPRQLSFKHTVQLWLCRIQTGSELNEEQTFQFFILVAGKKVGNRGGRVEPRAVKQRPKPFKLLTVKRELAREDIRENGHPKKLK